MKTPYTIFYDELQDSIDIAWNQAEEIKSGLDEMPNEEWEQIFTTNTNTWMCTIFI